MIFVPGIDPKYFHKRNELLVEKKDGACDRGKEILGQINGRSGEVAVAFVEHAKNCGECNKLLTEVNEESRQKMIYG